VTLEARYTSWALLVVTGLAVVGLALLYSRSQRVAAEIEWLERIPVLDAEP
jgi:hypothetical protein